MNTTEPRLTAQHDPTARTRWSALRETLRARRLARAAYQQRVRELAGYATSADRDDLFATLDRYDNADADTIRAIVVKQQRQWVA